MTSLELQDQYTRWTPDTLAGKLADRRLLLVLDNCEHLLDTCSRLVATLLRRCPDLRVLATSRQALGITGELIQPVSTLRFPSDDAPRPAEALRAFEAIKLFEDRAAAAVPHFEIDEHNGQAVTGLCRRLDGIPLAIELAVARLRILSPAQLLQRLNDRFNMLTSGNRAALPRHQTLRASIDWSFQLCTQQERALWSRASVFAESFDIDAAENVCSDAALPGRDMLTAVAGLLDKSVISRDERDGVVRYRLLETIRQYGREALRKEGREGEFQKRHRDWYLKLAQDTHDRWFGPSQVECAKRMRLEHPNIRAALEFDLAEPGESHEGLRIAEAYRDVWRVNGLTSEGRRWFDRLLARDVEPSETRAWALLSASHLALLQNDLTTANRMLAEHRQLAADLGDVASASHRKVPEAFVAMLKRDFSHAIALLEEFVAQHRNSGELYWLPAALVCLSISYSLRHDREQAMNQWQELLDFCEHHGERWRRAYALWGLGFETWRHGDGHNAEALQLKCLATQRDFHDQNCTAICLETMSWIAASMGRSEQAVQLAGTAYALRSEYGGMLFSYFDEYHDRCQEQTRQALGETAYANAFEAGTRMPIDQVIRRILGKAPAHKEPAQDEPTEQLTKREREVASLVAQGMSNKQIAQTLVISQRTAEAHVEHILTKLSFTSRSQIAAMVAGARTGHKASDSSL
ncbi:ATP-binding protein [Saccharopolyspora pogona]|uniref:ATP-binding protein n=1 Tax=Saccharopolyspora pogona TaxID=333966 RepID=UPI001CC22195|nr:LuxR C-terminal-related transcriptional regulator [Saccharopolyspora pogona]